MGEAKQTKSTNKTEETNKSKQNVTQNVDDKFVIVQGEGRNEAGLMLRIQGKKLQVKIFTPEGDFSGWTNFNPSSQNARIVLKSLIKKAFNLTGTEAGKHMERVCIQGENILSNLDGRKVNKQRPQEPWVVVNEKGVEVVKPGILAEHIVDQEDIITNSESGISFIYENGVYVEGRAKIRAITQESIPIDIFQNKHKTEVESWIIDATGKTPEEIEEMKPIDYANVKNGLVNLKTFELKPHHPDYISFSQVPVKYKSDAECPEFLKFLNNIVDIVEDRKVIQEYFGYTLLDGYPFAKALVLYGEGGTGKSTLIKILGGILGNKNISTETIQSISENRFRVAELFGKMANLCPDNPGGDLPESAMFKAITGKDYVSAEKKGTNAFHFVNRAKLLFSANELPRPKDASDAFFDRFIIVTFSNKFRDTEREIKDLDKKLVEKESEGILNWIFKGLKRLLERDKFSYNQTTEEIREEYIRKSNPVNAFFMDCIEEEEGQIIPKDEVYSAYVDYCKANKLHILTSNFFKPEFEKQSGSIIKSRTRIDKIQVHAWKGIKLKKEKVCQAEKSCLAQQKNESTPTPEKQANVANCAGVAGLQPFPLNVGKKNSGKNDINTIENIENDEKHSFFIQSSGERDFALQRKER